MRPDDMDRIPRIPRPDSSIVPLDGALAADPELLALEAELERAGVVARASSALDGADRPAPGFAASLRARLVAQLPLASGASVPPPAEHPVRGSFRRPAASEHAVYAPTPVAARVAARTPTILPAPRWTVLALAAAVIVALVGARAWTALPVAPSTRAGDVAGATLVRDGSPSRLEDGAALREGDEIDTAAGGRATIHVGASEVRLAGGSSVRIERLAGRLVFDQLAGRVYHRAANDAGALYVVRTGAVTWTASAGAFDVNRDADQIEVLAVEHGVGLDGPELRATVAEGRRAIVSVGGAEPALSVGPADRALLHDPWLLANATLDLARGFGIGILAGLDLALGPSATPAGEDLLTPRPTPDTTPLATPLPTAPATPKPTARPTPRPTAPPAPVALSLAVTSCNGGIVIDWSAYSGNRFSHYGVIRSTSASIPLAWPPSGAGSAVAGSTTGDRSKTSIGDTADGATTFYYRALALDASNRVLGASGVRSGTPEGVSTLGGLSVAPGDGGTNFGWTPLGGAAACFTTYKLVYSGTDDNPSYLTDATLAWAGGDPGTGSVFLSDLPSGTYWFRVQAFRFTDLGKFVVAESDVTSYMVP
ncbi:MAG: hypothetical protein AUG49_25685 [Catenulispora sp. 13_1_20CM_3_70_7]|nr:MAG: hypothetical protein AUG49_25685 [Catenulispora sp. 13_1_20CM_3_70_7]